MGDPEEQVQPQEASAIIEIPTQKEFFKIPARFGSVPVEKLFHILLKVLSGHVCVVGHDLSRGCSGLAHAVPPLQSVMPFRRRVRRDENGGWRPKTHPTEATRPGCRG